MPDSGGDGIGSGRMHPAQQERVFVDLAWQPKLVESRSDAVV